MYIVLTLIFFCNGKTQVDFVVLFKQHIKDVSAMYFGILQIISGNSFLIGNVLIFFLGVA